MPTLHLTKTVVDRIPLAESGQIRFHDNILRGFGLEVSQHAKVYFVDAESNGEKQQVILARADICSPEMAREKAKELLADQRAASAPSKQCAERLDASNNYTNANQTVSKMFRLTKSLVEKISFEALRLEDRVERKRQGKESKKDKEQFFLRDSEVRGFGLRIGRTTKVYFAEAQPNGKTRRVSIGRADVFAPEVARKKAQALLVEMAGGMDPNREKREKRAETITVSKAFEQMFAAKPDLSASALDNYGRTQRRYLADWADKNIVEITRQMVMAKHQKIGQQYGLVTANNVMRHFRSVFNFVAAGFDEFPQNPTVILTQARAWNREKRRTRVISNSDLPHWWKVVMAESDDARDIMLFALFTGMRRSEIVRLSWENVDLVGKKLHLDKTKNHDPLDLPLCQFLVDMIAERRERLGQSEWVFPSRNSSTGHIQEVKSFVYRIVGASGVEFSMHDLRRTFVTVAESLDINMYSLKWLLNHRANADVTHGYVIGNVERLRLPVERVAARILELANG